MSKQTAASRKGGGGFVIAGAWKFYHRDTEAQSFYHRATEPQSFYYKDTEIQSHRVF